MEQLFSEIIQIRKKNVSMCFLPKPCSDSPILQIIPSMSTLFAEVQMKRAGREGKHVLEQTQQRILPQTTEKYISCCFLPVSPQINRCCLGTSQHLMQRTSELNLRKVCFHVLVSPCLVSGLLFKSTLSNRVYFSWRFFACLFVLERRGL